MKRFLSIILAVILACSLSAVTYADQHEETTEMLRKQVQDLQSNITVEMERQAELIRQGTPANLTHPEVAEIRAQLDAIRTKLQAGMIQSKALAKQSTVEELKSPRLPCSSCGGALKQDKTENTGEVACQKYPVDMHIMDTSWAYYYECNSCGNEDVYFNMVCLH